MEVSMGEDMSNLMNQINQMIQNKQIPDEIQNMMQNLTGNNQSNTDNGNRQDSSSSHNDAFPEFDMETMLKMKKVMDMVKSNKDDPRANLLKSLKPYLKESRKEKVDQYIQIFGMGKVFEMLRSSGW